MRINVDAFLRLFEQGLTSPWIWTTLLIIGILGIFAYMVIEQLKMEGKIE